MLLGWKHHSNFRAKIVKKFVVYNIENCIKRWKRANFRFMREKFLKHLDREFLLMKRSLVRVLGNIFLSKTESAFLTIKINCWFRRNSQLNNFNSEIGYLKSDLRHEMLGLGFKPLERLMFGCMRRAFSMVKLAGTNQPRHTNLSLGFIVLKNFMEKAKLVAFDKILGFAMNPSKPQKEPDHFDLTKISSYESGLELIEFLFTKRLSQGLTGLQSNLLEFEFLQVEEVTHTWEIWNLRNQQYTLSSIFRTPSDK